MNALKRLNEVEKKLRHLRAVVVCDCCQTVEVETRGLCGECVDLVAAIERIDVDKIFARWPTEEE